MESYGGATPCLKLYSKPLRFEFGIMVYFVQKYSGISNHVLSRDIREVFITVFSGKIRDKSLTQLYLIGIVIRH